jgi:hypothetical protein
MLKSCPINIKERKPLMAKQNLKAPTVITLTLPEGESDDALATLLIQRGDLAHVNTVAYTDETDLNAVIREALMALCAVEANPPVITELPPSASSKKSALPPATPEPTVDIPLRKGKKTIRISHLKLTGGETDAAAYRQAVQLAAILTDGKLWDGDTPIRIADVYVLARKMKYLTPADMALFTLEDFVQVGDPTDMHETQADDRTGQAPIPGSSTQTTFSSNGHHANDTSDFSVLL